MRILGIDPGLANTGFGLIEIINKVPNYVQSGIITTHSTDSLQVRIKLILTSLNNVIKEYSPDAACIEKVFINMNPNSSLLLGQARGCAISSCVLNNLNITEYTALQIKKTVVGYGHADKIQVSKMVKFILKLKNAPQKDSSDALAIALTHFYNLSNCKLNVTLK